MTLLRQIPYRYLLFDFLLSSCKPRILGQNLAFTFLATCTSSLRTSFAAKPRPPLQQQLLNNLAAVVCLQCTPVAGVHAALLKNPQTGLLPEAEAARSKPR